MSFKDIFIRTYHVQPLSAPIAVAITGKNKMRLAEIGFCCGSFHANVNEAEMAPTDLALRNLLLLYFLYTLLYTLVRCNRSEPISIPVYRQQFVQDPGNLVRSAKLFQPPELLGLSCIRSPPLPFRLLVCSNQCSPSRRGGGHGEEGPIGDGLNSTKAH